ncbi:hypothetical protein V6N13_091248 [Hibiscus sabdariffa]|uniref:tRNA/rRNA methyltransferase SpoU type domain-containing protein n=1 Tax=Hibiscus sabdariffa TaxID=183260 RepID=A0ABR2BUX0_9ROSI
MAVKSYVVIHNIAKRHNVGTLARSATAFGVNESILVGCRDFNAFGSHGSTSHLRFRHFHSLTDARLYLKIWDSFVYIPQYGGGTASLNVTVAASIVLHHFGALAVWAGFSERIHGGNKFVVAERTLKQVSRKYCTETDNQIIEERKSRRESASNGFFEDGKKHRVSSSNLLDSLFPDE